MCVCFELLHGRRRGVQGSRVPRFKVQGFEGSRVHSIDSTRIRDTIRKERVMMLFFPSYLLFPRGEACRGRGSCKGCRRAYGLQLVSPPAGGGPRLPASGLPGFLVLGFPVLGPWFRFLVRLKQYLTYFPMRPVLISHNSHWSQCRLSSPLTGSSPFANPTPRLLLFEWSLRQPAIAPRKRTPSTKQGLPPGGRGTLPRASALGWWMGAQAKSKQSS